MLVQSVQMSAPQQTYTKRLVVLGVAITVGFCSIFAVGLWESRDRDREQARLAASNVVASMTSEIERNLEVYELSLAAVADGLKLPDIETMRPELRQRVLFDRAAAAKHMGSIFVLDRSGTLIYDSRLLAPMPEDHSDRDYFVVQKQRPQSEVYVSVPWRAAAVTTSRLAGPSWMLRGISPASWLALSTSAISRTCSTS
jgi:hypothetical protein